MKNIRHLLNQIATAETQLQETQFLAPCVPGGGLCTRVAGMVYTFQVEPADFEGWGIFRPLNAKVAQVVETPSFPEVMEYLEQFPCFRLRLAYLLQGQTWLAYPVNESDVHQRLGVVKPAPIHLVTDGAIFETILARWDGQSWWFEDIDRRADPLYTEALREGFKQLIIPEQLQFKGMTPEMKTVYDLFAQYHQDFYQKMRQNRDEERLAEALKMGGGTLKEFRDRDDHWWVEWITSNGEHHRSAISKKDLTVISSGICLSGLDRNFDLQSLVGVVEQR